MTYTTKDIRPVFERDWGIVRRFVVKGNVAFSVIGTGVPVFVSLFPPPSLAWSRA